MTTSKTSYYKNKLAYPILAVSSVVIGATIARYLVSSPPVPAPQRLTISATSLLRKEADPSASPQKYTLVEFIDYQCPPCRRAQGVVAGFKNKYKERLATEVRHYPLRFHKYAIPAAAIAEAARSKGCLEQVHSELFEVEKWDTASLDAFAKKHGLSSAMRQQSQGRVQSDITLAKSLQLRGTPSFLLCTPKGEVYYLSQLTQCQDFLDTSRKQDP